MSDQKLSLQTATSTLGFDRDSGRLVSFTSRSAPDQEFVASAPDHPAFLLHYLDSEGQYQSLDSFSAREHAVSMEGNETSGGLNVAYRGIGGMDLEVRGTVQVSQDDPFARWRVSVANRAGLRIVDVQYPFVVCAYDLGGSPGSETIVLPHDFGNLVRAPTYEKLGPDSLYAWQFTWRNGSFNHYPGGWFAQFLAYYNDRAGIFLATQDTEACVKRFNCLHRRSRIPHGRGPRGRLAFQRGAYAWSTTPCWAAFTGDWYDAADLYRELEPEAEVGHAPGQADRRPRVAPELPGPHHHPASGILDAGPVLPIEEFLPYEKCVPLLEGIADRVAAPLVAVIMGWERAGSWVYPDCFPPVGGEESVTRFARMCRQRGWHVGSFCNGTRWVVGHSWNGYDGRPYYQRHDGEASVCREADGRRLGRDLGRKLASQHRPVHGRRAHATDRPGVRGASACLGPGIHPVLRPELRRGDLPVLLGQTTATRPSPGKWMARAMEETVEDFRRAAERAGEKEVIQSVEMCCNEYNLQLFQQSDSRVRPPGHRVAPGDVIPLYQFLFHECIILHGMMSPGPEPYHVQIANAANGVLGEIPGGVLTGNGTASGQGHVQLGRLGAQGRRSRAGPADDPGGCPA